VQAVPKNGTPSPFSAKNIPVKLKKTIVVRLFSIIRRESIFLLPKQSESV